MHDITSRPLACSRLVQAVVDVNVTLRAMASFESGDQRTQIGGESMDGWDGTNRRGSLEKHTQREISGKISDGGRVLNIPERKV